MDDTLTLYLRANASQMSAVLGQVGRELRQVGQQAAAAGQRLNSGLSGAAKAAGSALSGLTNVFRGLIGAVTSLAQSIISSLVAAFQQLIAVATKAAVVVGGVLAAGFAAIAKTGVDMNVALATARAGLTAITGSAQKAEQFIKQLQDTAANTGPTFKQLLPIGQQLLSVFKGDGEKAITTIKALDAAVKVLAGGSAEAFGRAQLALSQMIGGRLNQEELNQLREALPGFDIQQTLTNAFGTADPEMLAKAGVTGRMAAEALIKGMEKTFASVAPALARSLPMAMSGIADAFNMLAGVVTQGLSASLEKAANLIRQVAEAISQNKGLLAALAVPFELVGKAIEYAASQLPTFINWLSQVLTKERVIGFIAEIVGWVRALIDEVRAFANAATGGQGFAGVWEVFRKAAETAIDFVLRVWSGLVATIEYFVKNSGKLWELLRAGFDFVRAGVEMLAGVIVTLLGVQALSVVGNLVSAVMTLGGALAGAGRGLAGLAGAGAAGGAAGVAGAGAAGAAGGLGLLGAGGIVAGGVLGGAAAFRAGRGSDPRDPWNIAKAIAFPPYALGGLVGGMGRGGPGASAPAQRGGAGGGGVQFGGAPGFFQGIGQGVFGAAGQLPASFMGSLPPELRDFLGGAKNAFMRGYQGGGLGPLMGRQQAYAGQARGWLSGMLGGGGPGGTGGGGAAGGDGMPPRSGMAIGSLGGNVNPAPPITGAMVAARQQMMPGQMPSGYSRADIPALQNQSAELRRQGNVGEADRLDALISRIGGSHTDTLPQGVSAGDLAKGAAGGAGGGGVTYAPVYNVGTGSITRGQAQEILELTRRDLEQMIRDEFPGATGR